MRWNAVEHIEASDADKALFSKNVSKADFLELFAPRFGNANPEKVQNHVWEWMARTNLPGGEQPPELLGLKGALRHKDPWSAYRYLSTITRLPNGDFVMIAGGRSADAWEEFVGYNDVVVFGAGGDLRIYGYPEDVNPRRLGHVTILLQDQIIFFGGNDSEDIDPNQTACIYSLSLTTFAISKLASSGDGPADGSLNLECTYDKKANIATVTDTETKGRYRLEMDTMTWSCIGQPSPPPAPPKARGFWSSLSRLIRDA